MSRRTPITLFLVASSLSSGTNCFAQTASRPMPLFFLTTRAPATSSSKVFASNTGPTSYGSIDMNVRPTQAANTSGSQSRSVRKSGGLPNTEIVDRHVTAQEEWIEQIRCHLTDGRGREILIFVHGFNLSFSEAARRAARFSSDVGFGGVTLLFSWPSAGQLDIDSYHVDQARALGSVPALTELVVELSREFPHVRRHIFAHSLGCRIVMQSAAALAYATPMQSAIVDKMILAAPDIDSVVFQELGAAAVSQIADGVTVYTTSKDLALGIAAKQNGDRRRAGSSVDVSGFSNLRIVDATEMLGAMSWKSANHMYYADSPLMFQHISDALHGGKTGGVNKLLQAKNSAAGRSSVALAP